MKMHLKMSSVKWPPFCPGGDDKKEFLEKIQPFFLRFKVDMILNIISLVRDIAWKLQADTFWQIFLNKEPELSTITFYSRSISCLEWDAIQT